MINTFARFMFGALVFVAVVVIGALMLKNFVPSNGNGYFLGILLLFAIGYVLRAFK